MDKAKPLFVICYLLVSWQFLFGDSYGECDAEKLGIYSLVQVSYRTPCIYLTFHILCVIDFYQKHKAKSTKPR